MIQNTHLPFSSSKPLRTSIPEWFQGTKKCLAPSRLLIMQRSRREVKIYLGIIKKITELLASLLYKDLNSNTGEANIFSWSTPLMNPVYPLSLLGDLQPKAISRRMYSHLRSLCPRPAHSSPVSPCRKHNILQLICKTKAHAFWNTGNEHLPGKQKHNKQPNNACILHLHHT